MLKALSDRPEVEKMEQFLDRLLEKRGNDLEFVVLFGSMAREDWTMGSDYDILIGLRGEDGKRLIDRMAEIDALVEGNIEVFPYCRSEWQRMFAGLHTLFLEALEDGVVLWDRGAFAEMLKIFRQWRESSKVTPWRLGWKIGEPKTLQ